MNAAETMRRNCALLEGLGDADLDGLVAGSETVEIAAGEIVFAEGAPSDGVFIVLAGKLAVLVARDWGEERVLEEIGLGELAGEVEILNGDRRLSDVRALEHSCLLSVPQRTFENLVGDHEEIWRRVVDSARIRNCRLLLSRQLNELFGTSAMQFQNPLLRLEAERAWLDFEREVLQTLEESVDWVTLERGEFLFREGEDAEDAFVVISGILQVHILDETNGERPVAEVGPGEIVGEIALFTEQERTASLLAMRDCELFRIPREVFMRTAEKYPQVLLNVYRSSFARLVRNTSEIAWRPKNPNVAVLRATPGVALDDFVSQLAAAMASHDTVGHFSSTSVDESLCRAGIAVADHREPAGVRLAQWLDGQERQFSHVVYQADPEWTAWTARCVRQADHVLVVADGSASPEIADYSNRVAGSGQRWSLVLLHAAGTDRPRATVKWVASSGIESVFHVRRGNADDIARLGRIVAGRAVSLVMGGGGARGFAHLGMIRALEEVGITIDMVGGASIGAPIAGWVAQGKSAAECLQSAIRAFKSLIDPTLPKTSLLAGKRISDVIFEETGAWDIEDYWLPFFCVSTNLTGGGTQVHRGGNSARAIRSSVSIPGILPPVPQDGDLLVDGGVLNNLPIDVMREINPSGIVIASDVVARSGLAAKTDYGLSLSGWSQAVNRFLPWRRAAWSPGIATVILQSTMLGSEPNRQRALKQGLADFYQNIHVRGVGMLQFDAIAIDRAAKIGYETVIDPVRAWMKSDFTP